jgi:hypothetical protein
MRNLRKRIWIDPFQTGLVVRIAAYLVVYQLIAATLFAASEHFYAAAVGAAGTPGAHLSSPLGRTCMAFLFLFPPLAWEAVRFAHRLVGPLRRFRQVVRAIAAGEPVALVQLRKGDLLPDFRDDFNAMLRSLEQRGLILLQTPESAAGADLPRPVGAAVPAVGR